MTQDISDRDFHALVDEHLRRYMNSAHINSFDFFTSVGIEQIFNEFAFSFTIPYERKQTEEDLKIMQITADVRFHNASFLKPYIDDYDTGNRHMLTPNYALLNGYNYSSPLMAGFTIKARADMNVGDEPIIRTEVEKEHHIANIPILVGSKYCHTRAMSKMARLKCGDDWHDIGGYCILKGKKGISGEWVIDLVESRAYNNPYVFYNLGHEKNISQLEFISKPGDGVENSSQIKLHHFITGHIYIDFSSPPNLADVHIPVHIIFRLFGMINDREIVENIIQKDVTDDTFNYVTNYMIDALNRSFTVPDPNFGSNHFRIIDHADIVSLVAKSISSAKKSSSGLEDKANAAIEGNLKVNILSILDKHLFPHLGITPDARHNKMRFLGHLIHKLLSVELNIIPSADRDTLETKRMNPAGSAYTKTFKTQFNLAIVQPIKLQLKKDFKASPFSQVQLKQSIKAAINSQDLERNLIQAITAGSDEIKIGNKEMKNRLASEMLYRKNHLNYLTTLRVIRTQQSQSSSKSTRASEMRMVHGSYVGYYCVVQSAATGGNVGLVKQQACLSCVTESCSSELMKDILRRDTEDLIPYDKVFPTQIYYENLTAVFVNYYPVGYCRRPFKFVQKYREMRRGYIDGKHTGRPRINSSVTIYWDTRANEILFWCDADRMLYMLLVVRNNTELDEIGQAMIGSKYDAFNNPPHPGANHFEQRLVITDTDVAAVREGRKTLEDLQREGKIEYISPDESSNYLVAQDVKTLMENRYNPLVRYTHCSINVSAMGLAALTSPYGDRNQPTRNIYQTNQVKQACGLPTLNHHLRMDKHFFVQHYVQEPLIQTIINKHIYPCGMNCIVGILAHTGYNQEDSIIINKSSANRGMFSTMATHIYSTKIDDGESLGLPSIGVTSNIDPDANYSKLQKNGLIAEGTVVYKNDVLISKYAVIPKNDSNYTYKDLSQIYTSDEPAIVQRVIHGPNQDNDILVQVKLISTRPLDIGCKFSSRAGQKGEVGMAVMSHDMPYSANGLVPDLIINPCAIPSRMTIGQLLEGLMGKLCAILCRYADATIFTEEIGNVKSIGDALEKLGFNRHGLEKLFNGFNGRWIDTEVFITPTYYQLLQKFAIDDMYVVSSGPTCILTHQPMEGVSKSGGLRIGEMEIWTMATHGSGHAIMEKMRDDSDGYDMYVCANCGKLPVVNEEQKIFRCNVCQMNKREPNIQKIRSTWSSKLLMQEIESTGINVELELKKYQNEVNM